eukprot:Opistho-1_new@37581
MADGGGDTKQWEFDAFDDGSTKEVKDFQQAQYTKFLEEHGVQLRNIEDAIQADGAGSDAWDWNLDPIALHMVPYEQTSVLELVQTNNKILTKVLTALSSLCLEIHALRHEAQTKFYGSLAMYGEVAAHSDSPVKVEEGEVQLMVARLLPLLQAVDSFVRRCHVVLKNVTHQLSALYTKTKSAQAVDVTGVHLQTMFEYMGELLAVLITLDEIIASNTNITNHWSLYKRMFKAIRADPAKFGTDETGVRQMERVLMGLESQLLTGNIFQNCVDQDFDAEIDVTHNGIFNEEFAVNIRDIFAFIDSRLGEANEMDQRQKFVGLCAIFVFHFQLFRIFDKKMFQLIWNAHRKVPVVPLVGNVMFFANDFLMRKIPRMDKVLDKKSLDMGPFRKQYLQQVDQALTRDAQNWYLLVSVWMVRMESNLNRAAALSAELSGKATLFIQGVLYAHSMSNLIKSAMNLHVTLEVPMPKSVARSLCRLIELLKAIEATYHRRSIALAECLPLAIQHVALSIISILDPIRQRLGQDKRYSNKHLDVLAALQLALDMLQGTATHPRRVVLNLALNVVAQMPKAFKEGELDVLYNHVRRLDVLCDLFARVRAPCDASFVFWHKVILPIYLQEISESPTDSHRLHYMVAALRDCVPLLRQSVHLETPSALVEAYEKELDELLRTHLLDPLCREIETDLRLHIHSHLQLDDRNPFKVGLKDLSHYLKVRPIRFFDRYIDIKAHVTHYLDTTFYNLTTVALHDWKTYAEMRNLAAEKYGLDLTEVHLPSQTLEQGLDVLEIMRNIHIFVAKYNYNLNNQIFVERNSNNKFLNTINIRHIANSIRTHGTGIMNTTVNFTFQYLRKKFFIFSQFLYDDHIKSRLLKDIRFFKDSKDSIDQKYPFERAEKFNKAIRKLGTTPDGMSYLDQFRMLITQIGNAMGYIRMIRSGGLHYCSDAIRFVPDIDDIVSFEELVKQENLQPDVVHAARNLDATLTNLSKNFAEGTEYFEMLVDVFAPELRDPKNTHLRNFYVIIPPLTINYVESILAGKEKVGKKNKAGATFTDDGFAMGVAYILKLLDQSLQFDSLHWFQAVTDKYEQEKAKLMESRKRGKDDEKLQQTIPLTLKRLETYQLEFELLHYSLSGARIFFRARKSDPDAIREEQLKQQQQQQKADDTASQAGGQDTADDTVSVADTASVMGDY